MIDIASVVVGAGTRILFFNLPFSTSLYLYHYLILTGFGLVHAKNYCALERVSWGVSFASSFLLPGPIYN